MRCGCGSAGPRPGSAVPSPPLCRQRRRCTLGAVNKFDLVLDPAAMPERIFALPELSYPDRLNIAAAIFADAEAKGWLDRTAYICGGRRWSYAALIDGTRRVAGALRTAGVGPEDRVILRMRDSPDLVMALLAVKGLGAIAIPTFVQLRADDLAYRARDTGARFLLVESGLLDEAARAHDAASGLERVIVAPADPTGRFDSLDALADGAEPVESWADTGADDLCLIVYTSGTTGRPKAAAHCHRDLMATGDTFPRYVLKAGPGDLFAGPPALPFTMGMSFFMYYPLRFGAASVLCPEKTVEAYVETLAEHRPTIFICVPTFYHRLLEHRRAGGGLALDSVRILLCAGEPLNPEFEIAWHEETGVPFQQLIGTTEMFHAFVGFRYGEDEIRRETLGTVCPGYEISVRDPDSFRPVPPGEPGLMCVRGPTATVYWSPREIQPEAVCGGWTVVNDLIRKDSDGFIRFVARRDEMIVSGGLNIAPVDVERILLRHPAVKECACVGAPDEAGERASVVKAFIVAADGATPGNALARDIQDFFKANGPPFMYPRRIAFVDALPKSLTGKVQRAVLKKREMEASGRR